MKSNFYLFLAVAASLMISCEKDDPAENENNDSNVVIITEDIIEPTTWWGDSVYLIKAWDFYVENTLTIKPGAIIKFHPTEGPTMALSGSGTVIARGTISSPVVFTSYKDDSKGGDTNGDGDATSPAVKDWGYISTNGMNGSVFKYCEFYYGGSGSYSTTLSIDAGSIGTVEYCTFAHNSGDDASGWYGALDMSGAGKGSSAKGNIYYDNVRPLSIMADMSIMDDHKFSNPDNPSETNTYNGIFVETINETTEADVYWQETEVPFVIDDNDWWINSGASLRFGDNVVLKFRPDAALMLEDGISALINYDGPGVFFTSYKDDSKKGDTNGDGSATSPGKGDWYGIYDNKDNLMLDWTNILYPQYPE